MSACDSMIGLILASVDGTLDASSRARLEAHAAGCVGCRRALEEQAAVKRMLADLPPIEVSRGFAARVRERVEQRPWWMPAGNWRLWTLRLAPVAALLTFFAVLPLRNDTASGAITGVTGGPAATAAAPATTPGGTLESWATAAVVAGANAAGEAPVVPQLLDPSVHAHTLLAPSASDAQGTSGGGSPR